MIPTTNHRVVCMGELMGRDAFHLQLQKKTKRLLLPPGPAEPLSQRSGLRSRILIRPSGGLGFGQSQRYAPSSFQVEPHRSRHKREIRRLLERASQSGLPLSTPYFGQCVSTADRPKSSPYHPSRLALLLLHGRLLQAHHAQIPPACSLASRFIGLP